MEEILQAMWAQRLGPGAKPEHVASNSTVADLEDSIFTDQGGGDPLPLRRGGPGLRRLVPGRGP